MKKSLSRDSNGRSAKDFMLNLYYFSRRYLIHPGGCYTLLRYSIFGGKEYLSLNTSKKAERTKEIIGACLDCFVEKGLMQLAKMKG